MKWAAAIFGVMLYVIWPYYTVLELSRAIQSGDAVMINRLVDWEQVRPSVKAQIQAQLEKSQNTVAQRELADKNPSMSKYVNAMTQKVASSAIDRMLTPEGIARLIEGSRERASLATASRQASAQPPGAGAADQAGSKPGSAGNVQHNSLWQRMHFASFVSPIHFRLDLCDPDREGADQSTARPTLTVMMIFKGTGWQVYDLRLSGFDEPASNVALAPK
jgi:Protein of unknown function (DUF2939)